MNKKLFIILLGLSLLLFMLEIRICPFFNLLGVPCPACGLTRAFVLFVQGRFVESIQYNILIIPLVIGFIIYCIILLIDKKKEFDGFLLKYRLVFICLAFALMIIVEFININNDLLY